MFLVSTRNFPPELGGMQNLMEGLSNALLNHGPVKVFAEAHNESEDYDQTSNLNIERVSGLKIFRKYRKANLVKEFLSSNEIRACFFDHWKSIENIDEEVLKKTKSFCFRCSIWAPRSENPGPWSDGRMSGARKKSPWGGHLPPQTPLMSWPGGLPNAVVPGTLYQVPST